MKLNFQRILFSIYALLFVVPPLLMYHKTSELFEFNKLLFIYFLSLSLGVAWLSLFFAKRDFVWKKTVLTAPLLIFLASQIASTVFSIDPHTSIFGYYGRFNGGLLSIISYIVLSLGFVSFYYRKHNGREVVMKLLKVSLVASAFVIAWGLPSRFGYDLTCFVFTGKLDVMCWTDQFKPTIRMFSTLGQPNWLGAYLVVHFFIGLYFFMSQKLRASRLRWVAAAYLFFNMATMLFTRSRSALLALGIGIAIYAWFMFLKRRTHVTKELKVSLLVLAAIILLPVLIIKTGVASIDKYIQFAGGTDTSSTTESQTDQSPAQESTQSATTQDGVGTESYNIRQIVWQGGYLTGMQYPLFGTGVETFAYSYLFNRPRDHNLTTEWDFVYNKAHNEYINYFATTGFIGLISYLVLIGVSVVVFKRALKTASRNSEDKDEYLLILSLTSAYVSILVTNFFGFSTTTINVFFYLLPMMALVYLSDSKSSKESEHVEVHINMRPGLLLVGCVYIFGIIYLLSYFYADVNYALGEGYKSVQDYPKSLQHYYRAYSLRKEHVYEDKIGQIIGQKAFVIGYGNPKEKAMCLNEDNKTEPCMELANRFTDMAINASPKNFYYYRTKARNQFLFYQVTKEPQFLEEANDALTIAQDISPTDPRIPYTKALFALGKYELTEKPTADESKILTVVGMGQANLAIKLKPDYRDAFYIRGLIEKKTGDTEAARRTFTHILNTFNPDDEQAQQELAGL